MKSIISFFTSNVGLKILALILAVRLISNLRPDNSSTPSK